MKRIKSLVIILLIITIIGTLILTSKNYSVAYADGINEESIINKKEYWNRVKEDAMSDNLQMEIDRWDRSKTSHVTSVSNGNNVEYKNERLSKDDLKATSKCIDLFVEQFPDFYKMLDDAADGGDFDTASCIDTLWSMANAFLPLIDMFVPGAGTLAFSISNSVKEIAFELMGGESATSSEIQMMDNINQRFVEIQNQLSSIEEEITELSNQIDESTNAILKALPSALDNAEAKSSLNRFISAGEGNFSYSQYRNYIYGTLNGNARANTAWNAKLCNAYSTKASDTVIKNYQDKLYDVLLSNQEYFFDYINPSSPAKDSIIKTYYKVVSANPILLKDSGDSPEFATFKFAYELYQTMIESDNILRNCYIYQIGKILSGNTNFYHTKLQDNSIEDIKIAYNALLTAELEVYDRIVCELADVIGMTDSYVVQNDNEMYYIESKEEGNHVLKGQTIYLNQFDGSLCELFGIEKNVFEYVHRHSNINVSYNGIFTPHADGTYIIDLYYNYDIVNEDESVIHAKKKINSITFIVGDDISAAAGSGTAEDPYLISTESQFNEIRNGLDKSYKLMCDMDFKDYGDFEPLGYYVNSNGNEAYKEFTGSIDGNGYKICNLTVSGNYLRNGLIAKLGESGVVTNLTFENVKISSDISSARTSKSKFYIGTIAAENNGTIKFCNIKSNNNQTYGLFFSLNNEIKNRCIDVYSGGICGLNNHIVSCCQVDNIKNQVESTHNFGGDSTEQNVHSAYIGGLVGGNQCYILYSLVGSGTRIDGTVKSIYNPQTTVNPYLTICSGGVCGVDCTEYKGIEKVCSMIDINQIICQGILDCQSNWGTLYNNFKSKKHCYIPEISEENQNRISTTKETIKALCTAVNSAFSVQYENGDNNISLKNGFYSLTTEVLKSSGFRLLFDGMQVDYTLLQVYNFEGLNGNFDKEFSEQATVLLYAALQNGQGVITKQTVNYYVAKNEVKKVTITPLETTYYTGDVLSLNGAGLYVEYIVGNMSTNIGNHIDYTVSGFSTDTITDFSDNSIAKPTYYITYCGVKSNSIGYTVLCEHLRNNDILKDGETVPATCCFEGYTKYYCRICDNYICKNFTPITNEHKVVYAPGKDSTCYETGYTSSVYCDEAGCDVVFEEEYVIPKKNHHFVAIDDIYHHCDLKWDGNACTCIEQHQYQITPSVEKIANKYYYVYDYICAGCGYSKRVVDKDRDVEENLSLPTVIVSNGYALNGGDEVTVYVQLVNNCGVSSANFGIKYDSNLVLLENKIEDGSVLKGSWISDSYATENGYNFVWGNAGMRKQDGNLLKLVFKVPYEFQNGKSFAISVVYDLTNGGELSPSTFKKSSDINDCYEFDKYIGNGGFVTKNNKREMFITIDGSITFVKHLPGDVNCDNVVDILDAIEIGKHLVGKIQLSNTVADLDLNGIIDPVDLTVLLQTLNGGYGASLSNPMFDLLINLNGAKKEELNGADLDALMQMVVSLYDDSGDKTYEDYGLFNLRRTGYKFDGWYTRIAIDESKEKWEDFKVELNDEIQYYSDQKRQTLYARWTLNQIDFDVTDATSGAKESVCYIKGSETQSEIIDSDVKQEYTIVLQDADTYHLYDNGKGNKEVIDCSLSYKVDCWEGSDGNYYTFNATEAGKDYVDDKSVHHVLIYLNDITTPNIGCLSLKAIWDDGNLEAFNLSDKGWDLTGYQVDSVQWYKPNNDGNYIMGYSPLEVKLDNHSQLKELAKSKEDKRVYLRAKFMPIEYTINFVINGDKDDDGKELYNVEEQTPHSIENKFAVGQKNDTVYRLTKTGYVFAYWQYKYEQNYTNYTNDDPFGYIDGVEDQEGPVIFTAQWRAVPFEVTIKGIDEFKVDGDRNYTDEEVLETLYYCYGDDEFSEGYYKHYNSEKGFTEIVSTLDYTQFRYKNFTVKGCYAEIAHNGHTTNNPNEDLKQVYFNESGKPMLKPTNNITIYAYCCPNKYKITFNLNAPSYGSTSSEYTQSVYAYYNETLPSITMPTNTYYKATYRYHGVEYYGVDDEGKSSSALTFKPDENFEAYWGVDKDMNDTSYLTYHTKNYKSTYYVKNATELNAIRNYTSNSFILLDNITLSGEWTPIPSFSGTLDGNCKKIIGLNCSVGKDDQVIPENEFRGYGLFKELSGTGKVKDISFVDCSIVVFSSNDNEGKGKLYAGIVAGKVNRDSVIDNITAYNLEVSVERRLAQYGGIAGASDGVISKCNIHGISMFGNGDEGGIVGKLRGTVEYCHIYGYTDGRKSTIDYYAVAAKSCGGLVGYSESGTIRYSGVSNTTYKLCGGYDKEPNMGYIVGHQKGGTIARVAGGTTEGCSYSPARADSELSSPGGLFGWGGYDYCDNYYSIGDWGWAGKVTDNPSVS